MTPLLLTVARATLLVATLLSISVQANTSRRLLQPAPATLSGKAIVLEIRHEAAGQGSERLLAVRTTEGKRVLVHMDNEKKLHGIRTGMDIQAKGEWMGAPGADGTVSAAAASSGRGRGQGSHFKAVAVTTSKASFAAPKLEYTKVKSVTYTATSGEVVAASTAALSTNTVIAANLNTLIIPIVGMTDAGGVCPGTQPQTATIEQLRTSVFNETDPANPSVASTYNQCSYGRTKMNKLNSAVADIVRLPCNGTTNGVNWTFSTCSFSDFNAYADAAEAQLRAQGFPLDQYKYRVYMVPPGACSFVGVGFVGCDGTPGNECRAWIGGNYWLAPNTVVHELAHNMYLGHAGAVNGDGWFDKYADASCAMGYCCAQRCFNTPHAWQLGWITVQQLDGVSLAPGQTVQATLASQATAANSGMRINPSWVTGVDPIFLGFRTATGGDRQLGANLAARVNLYTSPITNAYDGALTRWWAALTVNETWREPTSALVIRVRSISALNSVVRICRIGGNETSISCSMGMDNDCNGLAGAADPACAAFKKKRRP